LVLGLPLRAMKTIRGLVFWQYAKIISASAGFGKRQFGFVMNRFGKLVSGEINWSTSIREYVKEREKEDVCIYCGKKRDCMHAQGKSAGVGWLPPQTEGAVRSSFCGTYGCACGD